jgi:hypothetical protein
MKKDLIKIDEVTYNVNERGSLFLIKTHLKLPRAITTVLKTKLSSEKWNTLALDNGTSFMTKKRAQRSSTNSLIFKIDILLRTLLYHVSFCYRFGLLLMLEKQLLRREKGEAEKMKKITFHRVYNNHRLCQHNHLSTSQYLPVWQFSLVKRGFVGVCLEENLVIVWKLFKVW